MADGNKNIKQPAKKQGPKKPNFFVATFGELKQVSWPTFGDTMKQVVQNLRQLADIPAGVAPHVKDERLGPLLLQFIHQNLFQIDPGSAQYLTAGQIAALIVGGVLVVAAIAGVIAYKVVKSRSNKDR